ncbi:PorP/SprF family type IX secretion system membrane protein [Adhaeribacter sp. BT258]|uniref:PorP/SprF family type IX secretion system membrane protein n=1 Tax=Adhaeribacter terrigena TaxID=2793070 RepID=A0ABS1C2H5_9BACT|nr:PorP/SprF family type IX secretion system membrane protein [Adhaeribacter terrigena]MBK0403594.1 PorP/SprF family type IX secretion system membrane protein [Adhaeribacter terrigena]
MRVWRKVKIFLGMLLLTGSAASAQDAHFSQQYATKLRLNPAFVGLTGETNITAAYRSQWSTLPGAYITNHLSGEMRFGESKSSGGLLLMHDKAGSSAFTTFELSGIYGYHTRISKNFAVSAGMQATYGSRKVAFGSLTFGDQLSDDGLQNETSQESTIFYDPVKYLSVGAGGILYNDQLWLSIGTQHLNQPDLGFTQESRLPLKVTVNTGYKFYASTRVSQNKFYELSFTPTVTYTRQEPFSKIDLGFYTLYTPVTVGILYRGLELGGQYEQSAVFITGLQLNQFKFAYSYDLGLSGLSANAGGTHEISLAFEQNDLTKIFRARAANKKYLQIACPAF